MFSDAEHPAQYAALLRPTLAALLLVLPLAAAADDATLPDPTRPPAALAAPGTGEVAPEGTDALLRVQAIKISSRHKAVVIDGQEIPLGGRYGEYRVVGISPAEVVLRNGKEPLVLKLFPDVEKTRSPSHNPVQRKKTK